MFSNGIQDLRYAFRQLRKSPVFTLTALLTLAFGIGVTAAVLLVVQMVLLQPLPYPDQDQLVGVTWSYPGTPASAEQVGSAADFVREHTQAFASTAIMDDGMTPANLSVNGSHAVEVHALRVSKDYFVTLGVKPAIGRAFVPEEDRPGGPRAVVLSDGLWKRVFASDAGIVGRTIRINQESFTVVGVMPASFAVSGETAPGVTGTPDIWEALQLSPKDPGYEGDNYQMYARLRDGVSLEQAQQQLNALNAPFYQQYPSYKKWTRAGNVLHELHVWRLKDVVVSDVRRSLLTVLGAVIAVLLVACFNLAGLMIARALRRSREIAVRSALGATRGQLLRLLVSEGLLLAVGGGVLALVVQRLGTRILLSAAPLEIPKLHHEPGWLLVAPAVMAVSLAAMAVFSLLPAWLILRRRSKEIRLGSYAVGETVSHARLSRALVVAQVALAMVLVSIASVLLGTFVRLQALPSGVQPKQLTVFQVALKGDRYATTRATTQFVTAVLGQLEHLPGVDRVAAVNGLPLDRGLNMGGSPADRPNLQQVIEFRAITPAYFQTMGIPLLSGRDLADSDRADSDRVVLIGASAARKWWPGRSPIGAMIRLGGDNVLCRIVGVVADVQIHSLVESNGIVIYGPIAQLDDKFTAMINGWFPTTFAVRTAAHLNLAEPIEKAVASVDAEIPVNRMTTMQTVIDDSIQAPRFFSLLATCFSAFALVLTVIGMFGLMSYQVTQRTREIGVRMALGATRSAILQRFLGRGLMLAGTGVALGLAMSWWMSPFVSHLMSDAGIDPADEMNAAASHVMMNSMEGAMIALAVLLVASVLASWAPARRAAAIEPMQALRAE